jgi:hypothetical protein
MAWDGWIGPSIRRPDDEEERQPNRRRSDRIGSNHWSQLVGLMGCSCSCSCSCSDCCASISRSDMKALFGIVLILLCAAFVSVAADTQLTDPPPVHKSTSGPAAGRFRQSRVEYKSSTSRVELRRVETSRFESIQFDSIRFDSIRRVNVEPAGRKHVTSLCCAHLFCSVFCSVLFCSSEALDRRGSACLWLRSGSALISRSRQVSFPSQSMRSAGRRVRLPQSLALRTWRQARDRDRFTSRRRELEPAARPRRASSSPTISHRYPHPP